MKLKSYFANSVQDAIEKARIELGPDAMLIHSTQTNSELMDLGGYEVVFGMPSDAPGEDLQKRQQSSAAAVRLPAGNAVLQELADLRRQLALVTESVERANIARESEVWRPELAQIFHRLSRSGFSTEFAHQLTQAVALRTQSQAERPHRMVREHRDLFARDLLNAMLQDEISSKFDVHPSLAGQDRPTAVVLIGPPGAGKTTSLMKLALRYGLKERRPVHLVSLDTFRIDGCEHLNAFARISGAGFQKVHHHSMLEHAVTQAAGNSLTLIDTPGLGTGDESHARDLSEALCDLEVDIHLVLPAYATFPSAEQIARRFAKFKPSKLLITHMDEVEQPAVAIEMAARYGLPLSFLGNGQQVPEDLLEADKSTLLAGLMPLEIAASVAA